MQRIIFNSVSKRFRRQESPALLSNLLVDIFRTKNKGADFWALRDVTFTIRDGESVAVMGHNGAGKSTLLNIITGASRYETGAVDINGRVAGLLELGSGFHPDLTGRENLTLNAALLGMNSKQVRLLEARIIEFSGIQDAIDAQLRTYSTGMVMRLAFSIAIHMNPDILLIDEIIGVGDQEFQSRCFERITAFKKEGKTIVFVSHSPGLLATYCERALWLDHGFLVKDGNVLTVVPEYAAALTNHVTPG